MSHNPAEPPPANSAPVPGVPQAARLLFAALEHTELLVALYDPDDLLHWANPAYHRAFLSGLVLPVSFADVLRHGFRQGIGVKIDSADVEAFLQDILPRRRAGLPWRAMEVDTVDGRWLWMTETRLPEGWMMSVASDITRIKHKELHLRDAHQDAQRAARTDALTSLPNRRHALEFTGDALAQSRGDAPALSVAMIDLDHFKQINDTHGHAVGDAVLQAFAAHCQSSMREGDLFGRIGGEEFLLVARGADAAETAAIIERWRGPASITVTTGGGGSVTIGFSAGVAQGRVGDTVDTLINRADQALYQAKVQGRGLTIVAA